MKLKNVFLNIFLLMKKIAITTIKTNYNLLLKHYRSCHCLVNLFKFSKLVLPYPGGETYRSSKQYISTHL